MFSMSLLGLAIGFVVIFITFQIIKASPERTGDGVVRTVDCVFLSRVIQSAAAGRWTGPSPGGPICLIEGGDLYAENTGYR